MGCRAVARPDPAKSCVEAWVESPSRKRARDELVRVWAAAGAQHVTLATGLWDDPAAWGLALVDLARHVARAYAQTQGKPPAAVLRRIREGFDAEWGNATDTPTGSAAR